MNAVKFSVPEASTYSLESSSTTSSIFSTPSTSLYVTSDYSSNWEDYSDENSDNNVTGSVKFVTRKRSAIRTAKKKRGSLLDANNPRHRVKGLLRPIVVFKFVKDRFKRIESRILGERLERIAQILEATTVTNQIALREKIESKFAKLIREQEMYACGFDKFFEREILQAFVDSVKDRAIKITPIKNYTRLIPKNVRERMEIAKEKKLFDDFVVIHTDPENKAVEKTEEEKKDPILCGVIKQSSRYYFVGDWEDELCNLTMDTILSHLGLDEDDVSLPEDVEASLIEML